MSEGQWKIAMPSRNAVQNTDLRDVQIMNT
jgi:hypothetical protein